MYKFFTSKKGFTVVELMIVLLLSLGVLALANMFRVTYRAFNKSEERYLKQEAVKYCAGALGAGRTNVAAAEVADIYNNADVVPPGEVSVTTPSGEETTKTVKDKSYSYLFAKPHEDDEGNRELITEEYNLNYSSCYAQRDPEFDVAAAEPRIAELHRSIRYLGHVNLDAIEQVKSLLCVGLVA